LRRLLLLVTVLAVSGLGVMAPTEATAAPLLTLSVSGTEAAMYPTFDPAIERYGLTTTAATGGSVDVVATTPDPAGVILVNGRRATSSTTTHLSGLTPGDEISVIIDDAGGATAYSVVYLPPGFPAMAASPVGSGLPGYLGVGLTTFATGPSFEALLDHNGVPAWVHQGSGNDFKRQPNGELTVMRPTTTSGTGSDLVTLDEKFDEVTRRHMDGLVDTDNHDAERLPLPDGGTILIGYEPRGDCTTGYLDATIQKLDAVGTPIFSWNSSAYMDPLAETLNPLLWPMNSSTCQRIDYAHVNSVEEIPDGTHDLLVSFRHLSAVYRIATVAHDGLLPGDIVWRLGGRHSSFTFVGGPAGGPCAQHDVTWIGPERVLLFDNGSAAFGASAAGCVDPSDPQNGNGVARPYTQVSEYLLDPAVGTATLEWSYAPANTFTFFAGSATRLDNGDTLIGWASDRATLATVVDHAATPNVLWSLAIPGNDPSTGYTSYRVSRVDYTDAIAPTPSLSLPGDATYTEDQTPVTPTWSCTDRGGSNLATCTVDGLVDGHLATTVGTHTVSVTATDGAGNTSTVTRNYTVRALHFQPDGLVRKAGTTAWKGSDYYGSASGQRIRQQARRRQTVKAFWRIQNYGERADDFRLVGTGGNRRFRVRYLSNGVNVTAAVVAGTYRTPAVAPGQSVILKVVVTPTRRARIGSTRRVTMAAVSVSDPSRVDRVASRVTARR
jgi:hypothetical protein